jgi:predicted O-methyltransferase YrrM
MSNLRQIDRQFVDEYIFNHRNKLGEPRMGGTDWRFADIVAPAFREVLEIAKPDSVLEIGFNAGGSASMFLQIDPTLIYHSIDIELNQESKEFLEKKYNLFKLFKYDSKFIDPVNSLSLRETYDMVFVDGEHTPEGVVADIESALKFQPGYILFDDYRHPSHVHIEKTVTEVYKDKLEVVKVFEFNQCWVGYSMALCKVK